MTTSIVRTALIAGLLAFATVRLAAAAAPLTAAQSATLAAGTKAYFKSLATGDMDALSAMTTPDFKITRNGKPISAGKLSGLIQAAKLNLGSVSGSMHIDSASVATGVVTEVVTLNGHGEAMRADGEQGVAGSTQHRLTWVKSDAGKWRVSQDQILSATRT